MAIDNQSSAQVKENVERIREDIRERASHFSQIAQEAQDKASEYYEDASEWLSENKGKALAVAGLLVAAGLIGYAITKKNSEFFEREAS